MKVRIRIERVAEPLHEGDRAEVHVARVDLSDLLAHLATDPPGAVGNTKRVAARAAFYVANDSGHREGKFKIGRTVRLSELAETVIDSAPHLGASLGTGKTVATLVADRTAQEQVFARLYARDN